MISPLAVFRADGSSRIGGGHVLRCLSLARGLQGRGWRCGFAVHAGTLAAVPILAGSGFELFELDTPSSSEQQALVTRWPEGVDLLVVDHYGCDAGFERSLRSWARRIMVIDDLADRPHDCDLLLDQTLDRQSQDYGDRVPAHCRLLLGPQYALIAGEFAALRDAALLRRRRVTKPRSLLVNFGATDPHRMARRAIEGVVQAAFEGRIEVILGANEDFSGEIAAIADHAGLDLGLTEFAPTMAPPMAQADLALSAAGTSSWERCCLGLPSLVVMTAENQHSIANALERCGAACVIGRHETVTADDIAQTLTTVLATPDKLIQMSRAAATVCDGQGVERAVAAILEK
jgi:UDP-2,4-diacetamido-2,4,6-trideoxy-beta-L-altropyranose hydrolase